MILTIIVFILILGLLIFSHEFGHFISAKKAGMKVEEFGFGFPPRLFGIKKGETLYSINLIPLGGFVRIFGQQRPEKEKKISSKKISQKLKKRAFYNKPIWQRAIVLVMGVTMNLLLAVILLSVVHGLGVPTIIEEGSATIADKAKNVQIQIIGVAADSPAQETGLKVGDAIKKFEIRNSKFEINEVEELQELVARYVGQEITLVIQRGEESLEKTIIPRISPPEEEGPLGIVLAKTGLVSYPWHLAVWQGLKATGRLVITFITLFYQLFKNLIVEGTLMAELAGPVGIAALTSQVTKLGLVYILQFAAILSINLTIINAIPFPALDGGQLLFLAIEKIKGSPVSAKLENLINNLGFVFLIALMILVTFRDVARLF